MEETPKIQPAALAGVLAPCRMTLTGGCEEGEGEEGRPPHCIVETCAKDSSVLLIVRNR